MNGPQRGAMSTDSEALERPAGTILVKLGGEIVDDPEALDGVCRALRSAQQSGRRIVLVHGGGRQATGLGERLGIPSTFVGGRRVTDAAMLEVVIMAIAGAARMALLAAMRRAGVRAVGVTGVDAAIVRAHRRPLREVVDPATGERRSVDFGCVGDVDGVDGSALADLLDAGFLPVVTPLAADDAGNVLNVNADSIAAAVAGALGVDTWIVASNVAGVRNASGAVMPRMDPRALPALVADGTVHGGMVPKLEATREALERGVRRVVLVDGTVAGPLSDALDGRGGGTVIAYAGSGAAVSGPS